MKKIKMVTIPVDDLMNLIETATARGMQRGAQMVIEMGEPDPEPKPNSDQGSLFIGDNEGETAG